MDIIVLNRKATEKNITHLLKKLESKGLKATVSRGTEKNSYRRHRRYITDNRGRRECCAGNERC